MTFDGETISLYPSIGNWNFPCRSHYWIDCSRVRRARLWTDDEIVEARREDEEMRARYYRDGDSIGSITNDDDDSADPGQEM
jgi:hypothetical protein